MAILQSTIDQIRATAKIEDVVGEYVSLKRRGANLWGLCPYPGHNEKTPSFSVSTARNSCHCFGCGNGGDSIKFIMEMEQCTFWDAVRKLAKKYHIEIEEREMTEEDKQRLDTRKSMLIVNKWANDWYQDQLWNSEEGRAIGLSYFRERGLRDETIRRFQLGYSPEKAYLLPQAAKQEGYKEEFLVNDIDTRVGTGICGRSQQSQKLYDRYHDRVIFPFLSISGETVGFAGRIIKKRDDVGKYVNSPESMVYFKKRELFGLFQARQAIRKQQKCYWVEGQMDCISMSQAGIENVVCTGGTSLTKEQIQLVHRFTEDVTILYDGDAAGIHAAIKGIDMFLEEGLNIKVMLFPDGDDPDSFARKHTAEEFRQYIEEHEEDFIRYKSRTLLEGVKDLRKRSEAIHSIISSVALISDRITRDLYIKDIAHEFDLSEKSLLSQLVDERKLIRERNLLESNRRSAVRQVGTETPAASNEPPIIGVDDEPMQEETAKETPQPLSATDENMKNLIRLLMRHGSDELHFANPDGSVQTLMVGEYLLQYIQSTRLPYGSALYESVFNEFAAHKSDPQFQPRTFYMHHPDPAIANLATQLLFDQYMLCRTYEKNETEMTEAKLTQLMMQLLYELHLTVVEEQLQQLGKDVQQASANNDLQRYSEIYQVQQQLRSVRDQLNSLLGKH